MVKKVSKVCVIILFLILISLTVYKLNKRHEDKLYNVLYSEIKYQAERCYLENKCESNIVLSELYDKKYLSTQYDPISKEELSKDIKIVVKNESVEIKEKK